MNQITKNKSQEICSYQITAHYQQHHSSKFDLYIETNIYFYCCGVRLCLTVAYLFNKHIASAVGKSGENEKLE